MHMHSSLQSFSIFVYPVALSVFVYNATVQYSSGILYVLHHFNLVSIWMQTFLETMCGWT